MHLSIPTHLKAWSVKPDVVENAEVATNEDALGNKSICLVSPPYAILYGWWIPSPIYGYGYGAGIMRLIRMVVDTRSETGNWGPRKIVHTSEIKMLK